MSWSANLTYGDTSIVIGDGPSASGVNATSGGIEGWYSTPEAKWSLTEKTAGHGAYALYEDDEVLYSARTVTLHVWAEGGSRREVVENKLALLGCAGQEVELQVSDGGYRTHVNGYATVEDAAGTLSDRRDEMTITIECPDPYRYLDGICLDEWSASGKISNSDDFYVSWRNVWINGVYTKGAEYEFTAASFSEEVTAAAEVYPTLHVKARTAPISYLFFQCQGSDISVQVEGLEISLDEVYVDMSAGVAYDGDGNDVSSLFSGLGVSSIENDVDNDISIIVNAYCDVELELWGTGDGEKWL